MDQVYENIWIGDWDDGKKTTFPGTRLCVIEGQGPPDLGSVWIPIMPIDGSGVSIAQLSACAAIINHCVIRNSPILVHCGAGIERSPLTVVWWLVKKGIDSNLDVAYRRLKKIRPIVQDRREWLRGEVPQ